MKRPPNPRLWKIVFRSGDGQKCETGPYTRKEVDRRMRSTEWTPGAKPQIVKTKES